MKSRIWNASLILVLSLGLILSAASVVHAQGATDSNTVTFFQLGESEIDLAGPYDSQTITFGLPADWKLDPAGAQLELFMTASFYTVGANNGQAYGGNLVVTMNKVTLGVLPINAVGETTETLTIPPEALVSQRTDGRMELVLLFDSAVSCDLNQNMRVLVHSSSRLVLPHTLGAPELSLVNFPRPLYQDSIAPDSALVVIPDKPSASDLQAAMTVAAGLGNLTNEHLALDLTTVGQLTNEQKAAGNLIMVGNAASLSPLSELTLPQPMAGGKFQMAADGADDGVVALAASPWNPSRVVLVVSGNTDVGTVKAAQAVSTGLLRTAGQPNLALVQTVEPNPIQTSIALDQTLSDLGYQRNMLNRIGVSSASYNFYIPAGQEVTSDAYFELVMGHSALLDYDRSGMVVSLNGQPIGSVRFSDETARQANNLIRIPIPASAALTGNNRLDVTADLRPVFNCNTPNFQNIWAVVWPESRLHLPLTPSQASTATTLSLDVYPAPFIYDATLHSTAFILPQGDLTAWKSALQVATFLGNRSNGPLVSLNAFYGDQVSAEDRANYNLILFGRPSQLPIIGEMSSSLPIPFTAGTDQAEERDMQVIYRIPADVPVGYIELFSSPWNQSNLVLAITGNSAQGVTWSGAALVDATLRAKLGGNFAAISGTQVVTADTRMTTMPSAIASPVAPDVVVTPDAPTPIERPAWVLPTAIAAGVLAVVILLIALFRSWSQNRK